VKGKEVGEYVPIPMALPCFIFSKNGRWTEKDKRKEKEEGRMKLVLVDWMES
jgi:hypothetical protein